MAIETASTVSDSAEHISSSLGAVVDQFRDLLDRQNMLIETSVFAKESAGNDGKSDDNFDTSMDIELF